MNTEPGFSPARCPLWPSNKSKNNDKQNNDRPSNKSKAMICNCHFFMFGTYMTWFGIQTKIHCGKLGYFVLESLLSFCHPSIT